MGSDGCTRPQKKRIKMEMDLLVHTAYADGTQTLGAATPAASAGSAPVPSAGSQGNPVSSPATCSTVSSRSCAAMNDHDQHAARRRKNPLAGQALGIPQQGGTARYALVATWWRVLCLPFRKDTSHLSRQALSGNQVDILYPESQSVVRRCYCLVSCGGLFYFCLSNNITLFVALLLQQGVSPYLHVLAQQ
jgi:hypothetical protein